MRKTILFFLSFCILMMIHILSFGQSVLYITTIGGGTQDGSSWLNALPGTSIQTAINNATLTGQVWVAKGTYPLSATLTMRDDIAIYGGFAGTETSINDRDISKNITIIDGLNLHYVINNATTLQLTAIMDGFTIRRGSYALLNTKGGTFNNCIFADNAVYGLYCCTGNFTNCKVTNIKGTYGIAVYSCGGTFTNLVVTNNQYAVDGNTATFTNCLISNNTESGIRTGSANFTNCIISNNLKNGIERVTGTFINCIITGNQNGILNSQAKFYNCDIINNSISGIDVSGTCSVSNCIIWGNVKQIQYTTSGTTFTNCAIQGGFTLTSGDGGNNIALNAINGASDGPNFFNIKNDWSLSNTSPCIDKGKASVNTSSSDILGNLRLFGNLIDIGAVEYNSTGNNNIIALSKDTINIADSANSSGSLNITTGNTWNAVSNQTWLNNTQSTQTVGNGTLIVIASKNVSSARTAIVSVNGYNAFTKYVTVIQAMNNGEKTLILSAGGLAASLTAQEKSYTKKLTISGTIDARDFKTMRDSMPSLSYIDISNATIAVYSGTLGTYSTSTTVYSANEIAKYAFYKNTIAFNTVLKTIILPISITSIGSNAFQNCSSLTNVIIPQTVTNIGSGSFFNCFGLTTITIPSNVTVLNVAALEGCKNLKTITILSNKITELQYSTFQDCISLETISLPTSIKAMYGSNFQGCTNLKSIVVPPLVTMLAGGEFQDCINLTSLTLPPSITSITNAAFKNCTSLTSVIIPNSVNEIGLEAFDGCTGLISISLPSSVYLYGNNTFRGCIGLKSIYVNRVNPINLSSYTTVFKDVDKINCILYVPKGKKSLYQAANQWQDFNTINDGSSVSLQLSKSTCTLDSIKGSFDIINVISDTVWYVSTKESWLTLSQNNSTGNGTLSITAQSNIGASRIGKIIVRTITLDTLIITVTQLAGIKTPYLLLASNSVSLAKDANSTSTVNITSNVSWTASSKKTWLTLSPTTATSGNVTLTFTATANTGSARIDTVTISATGISSQTIIVTQANGIVVPVLSIQTDTVSLKKDAGSSATINITSSTTWVASSDQSWLIVNPNSQTTGSAALTVTALPNTGATRTAIVTIIATGVVKTITVTQAAGNSTEVIEINENNISLYPNPATNGFSINYNGSMTIEIYTGIGTLVLKEQIANNEFIKTSSLPAGLYFIKILTGEKLTVLSLIKQ